MKRLLALLGMTLALLSVSGCGYNSFQTLDEESKSAWSEVLNQYQRRADLIPNIVNTVKGEANFEKSTLEAVIGFGDMAATADTAMMRARGIAEFKVPDQIVFVPEFATTAVGKISRKALRAALKEKFLEEGASA